MTDRELELVVLGMVLANPELLKDVDGWRVIQELQGGSTRGTKVMLGNIKVERGKTVENVLAEWRRRAESWRAVHEARQALFKAQSDLWQVKD